MKSFWLDTTGREHKAYIYDIFDDKYYVCQKCNKPRCEFFFTGMIEDTICFTLIDNGCVNIKCDCESTYYEFCCYHPTNMSINSYNLEQHEWQFLKYFLTDKAKRQILYSEKFSNKIQK